MICPTSSVTATPTPLVELAAAGELVVPIHAAHPLRAAAQAHRAVEGGHVRGKVVLRG